MLLTHTRGVILTQIAAARGFIGLSRDRDGDLTVFQLLKLFEIGSDL